MKIEDILRGCEPGRLQSVGHMQVLPLLSDLVDDRFVSPINTKVSNKTYGHLCFRNDTPKTVIIPSHAGYLTKKRAQDHAMTKAGLVPALAKRDYNDAVCIESSQPGTLNEDDAKELIVLPVRLREYATVHRSERSYSRLWSSIGTYSRSYGVQDTGGHLKLFFETFREQLDLFVAEFEPVDRQVGAIVLVGGNVIGVERAPSHDYWLDMWPVVIRCSYGAEALGFARENPDRVPDVRSPLGHAGDLDGLAAALEEAEAADYATARGVIDRLIATEFAKETDETVTDMTVMTISNDQLIGQTVLHDERTVYCSLISKEQWRRHGKWREAPPFVM
jgi:hypothetical protein